MVCCNIYLCLISSLSVFMQTHTHKEWKQYPLRYFAQHSWRATCLEGPLDGDMELTKSADFRRYGHWQSRVFSATAKLPISSASKSCQSRCNWFFSVFSSYWLRRRCHLTSLVSSWSLTDGSFKSSLSSSTEYFSQQLTSCRLLSSHHSHLPSPRRLSSVLSKFSHPKK